MTFLLLPFTVLVIATISNGMFDDMVGTATKMAPLVPNDDEKELCSNEAESKEVKRVYKVPKRTCYVQCELSDGETSELKSPKETPCCDTGGLMATGKCDGKGNCNALGMEGMKEFRK